LTRLRLITLPIPCGPPTLGPTAAVMLSVALATAPTSVLAEAQVRGNPEAVTIEAKNTSVQEILAALSGTFDLHYRSSANLDTRLTGNYQGSLQKVMKRVLDGYSYFAKIGDDRIDLTVLDTPRTARATGDSLSARVVARAAEAIPAQPLSSFAAVEPPVIADSPATPLTEASPSFRAIENDVPAKPLPAITELDPPVLPISPAAPSSRKRDHLIVADGKESRLLPPRRIKVASSSRQGRKSKHHIRRTSFAQSLNSCGRSGRSFGRPMIPVSSYYWLSREPLDLRPLPNWHGAAIPAKSRELNCRTKRPR
jgi:hypothetical protein